MATYLYGVDVHPDFQRGLHWPTLYAQGYRYGAVKHTQGTGYLHNLTDEWVRDCRAAGLLAGGYHWLDASDGAMQARWFYKRVVECGGPTGMLIMLDVEDTGRAAQVTAWAREWNRLSHGHPFAIYTGGWWWKPNMGSFNGPAITPTLWHSSYLDADVDTVPDDPAAFASRIPASWWKPNYGGWREATFLQFSSRGDAGRLANNVDLNATRLTMAELRALAGLGPAGAPGGTGGPIVPIPNDTPRPAVPPVKTGVVDMPQILVRLTGLPAPDRDQIWLAGGGLMRRVSLHSVAGDQDQAKVLAGTIAGNGPVSNAQVHAAPLLGELANGGKVYQSAKAAGYTDDEYRTFWGTEYPPTGEHGVSDADLTKVTAAAETAVKAGVSHLLAGAGLNVTGQLELNPLPPKP